MLRLSLTLAAIATASAYTATKEAALEDDEEHSVKAQWWCPRGQESVRLFTGDASSGCSYCKPGYYQWVHKGYNSACKLCDFGKYSHKGAGSCTKCPAGTMAYHGASSCTKCEPGKYSVSGAYWCTHCEAGKYSASGSSSCTKCPAGKYKSNPGYGSCKLCEAGYYSRHEGSPKCDRCRDGSMSAHGASYCDTCRPGTVSDGARFSRPQHGSCKKCDSRLRLYQTEWGKKNCLYCPQEKIFVKGGNPYLDKCVDRVG